MCNTVRSGMKGMYAVCVIAILLAALCGTMKVRAAEETESKKTGWVVESGKTYYLDENGEKVTGLQKIEGRYYYFSKKGVQKAGWCKIKGKKYYFLFLFCQRPME